MPYGTVVADVIQNTTGYSLGAGNASIMKNRLINGAMVISQRGTASVTPTNGQYLVDRFFVGLTAASKFTAQQNAGSVTPPVGFTNYLGITSSSAFSVTSTDFFYIAQAIEGFNTADLQWGTAQAKTVCLSFQVYSSLTGTFGGSLRNSAGNRSYPFSYTVSSANTWTQISVTVAGDTSGTWVGATNGNGIQVQFSLGAGTTYSGTAGAWAGTLYVSATGATSVVGVSGATLFLTGVQLEVGSSSTGFEYVNYQTSLANCQRYYYKTTASAADNGTANSTFGSAYANTTTGAAAIGKFPVTLRTYPTALEQSGTAAHYQVQFANTNTACSAVPTYANTTSTEYWRVIITVASGLTAGQGGMLFAANASAYLAWSAEL
jgi:hypothetical protein